MTIEQLNELKKEIRHVKLLENDSADVWKKKLVDLKALWNRLPERVRGADQTLLCSVIVKKLPKNMQRYKDMIDAIITFNKDFMTDAQQVIEKMVNMHRGTTKNTEDEGGRAYLFNKRGENGKKSIVCYNCGLKGHIAKDCMRTCKATIGETKCGLKCCGGVKGADKCMVVNGIPPNTKLPPHIVAKIEKRANEMKRGGKGGKSAMMAFGEASDDSEMDDEYLDGHAFVARCVQVDADGAEHFVEDDDDFEEVVAYEVIEPSGAGKDTIATVPILSAGNAKDCSKPNFGDACSAKTGGNCTILTVYAPRDTTDVRDAFIQAPVAGGVFVRPPPEDGGGEADNAEIGAAPEAGSATTCQGGADC